MQKFNSLQLHKWSHWTVLTGLSGFGATHFDIGGYTSLVTEGDEESVSAQVNMLRTEELLLRGAEAAVFTPVFRSHEGNNCHKYNQYTRQSYFVIYRRWHFYFVLT